MRLIDKRGVQNIRVIASKAEIEGVKIRSSRDIWQFCMSFWDHDTINYDEDFYVILLSRRLNTKGVFHISKGGTTGAVVCLKKMFMGIVTSGCDMIALAHNHPIGALVPSDADKDITRKIETACKTLEIKLIDHLIVTDEAFYSFRDEGLIN